MTATENRGPLAQVTCPRCGTEATEQSTGNPYHPTTAARCPECGWEWETRPLAARSARERLEYLRGELRAERIGYGELAELQGLAEHIESGDVELLEAAGVPEFPEEPQT